MRRLGHKLKDAVRAALHDLFAESAGPHRDSAAPADPLAAQLAAVQGRLAALEAQAAAGDASELSAELSDLRARLTGLLGQYQRLTAEARALHTREAASALRHQLDNSATGLAAQLAERLEALARRADRQAAREALAREQREK